jgi:hypothetical protein
METLKPRSGLSCASAEWEPDFVRFQVKFFPTLYLLKQKFSIYLNSSGLRFHMPRKFQKIFKIIWGRVEQHRIAKFIFCQSAH